MPLFSFCTPLAYMGHVQPRVIEDQSPITPDMFAPSPDYAIGTPISMASLPYGHRVYPLAILRNPSINSKNSADTPQFWALPSNETAGMPITNQPPYTDTLQLHFFVGNALLWQWQLDPANGQRRVRLVFRPHPDERAKGFEDVLDRVSDVFVIPEKWDVDAATVTIGLEEGWTMVTLPLSLTDQGRMRAREHIGQIWSDPEKVKEVLEKAGKVADEAGMEMVGGGGASNFGLVATHKNGKDFGSKL